MFGQENRKRQRTTEFIMNAMHIVIGVLVVILGILAFLNPKENMMCFPLIFFLASVLNMVNGFYHMKSDGRERRRLILGFALVIFGVVLAGLGVVSTLSILWG